MCVGAPAIPFEVVRTFVTIREPPHPAAQRRAQSSPPSVRPTSQDSPEGARPVKTALNCAEKMGSLKECARGPQSREHCHQTS